MHDSAHSATQTMPDAADTPRPNRPSSPAATQQKICPYCGHRERAGAEECTSCRGLFEPLSLVATQNAMGPWQIRDDENPHRPGCSIETLRQMIRRGKLTRETILRGPTTRQFWRRAGETPGVAHLLGVCHTCAAMARPEQHSCPTCGESFLVDRDRNWLGLDHAGPSPHAMPAPGDEQPRQAIPAAGAPVAAPIFDLFQGPQTRSGPTGAASTGSTRPTRAGRNPARRQAVAAATVALCAALLSVAVWAATASGLGDAPDTAQNGVIAAATDAATPAEAEAPLADPTPLPATPEQLEQWRLVLERVELLEASGDIESLEHAVRVLREVDRDAPVEARPEGLQARIDALEAAIDDLTIQKFLRQSGDKPAQNPNEETTPTP